MGRRIDRLIGFVLLITAAYLLFLRATDSVGLACGFYGKARGLPWDGESID